QPRPPLSPPTFSILRRSECAAAYHACPLRGPGASESRSARSFCHFPLLSDARGRGNRAPPDSPDRRPGEALLAPLALLQTVVGPPGPRRDAERAQRGRVLVAERDALGRRGLGIEGDDADRIVGPRAPAGAGIARGGGGWMGRALQGGGRRRGGVGILGAPFRGLRIAIALAARPALVGPVRTL